MFRFEHVMPHAFGVMWPNANSPQFTPPSPSPRRYLVGFGSGGMLHGTAREGPRTVALSTVRNSCRETASHESDCLEVGIRSRRIGAIMDRYAGRIRRVASLAPLEVPTKNASLSPLMGVTLTTAELVKGTHRGHFYHRLVVAAHGRRRFVVQCADLKAAVNLQKALLSFSN
jgi:hypothetical protein